MVSAERRKVLSRTSFAFDRYTVDPVRRLLMHDGKPIAINGKAFDLLVAFLESGGAVLSREQLYERLWPGGFVEDGNLSQNVYLVRRCLAHAEGCIETLPRYGYRFTVPVREVSAGGPARFQLRPAHAAVVLLLLVAGAVFAWRFASARPATANLPPQARQAYALAVYHLDRRQKVDLIYALAYFRQVAARAPRSSRGYAGMAQASALLAEFEADDSSAQRRLAMQAEGYRDEALARDPDDSGALATAGFIAYRFHDRYAESERDLERAVRAGPNDAIAHHWYGVVLLNRGRIAASVREFETARRLDPTSEVYWRWLARAYAFERRPADAAAAAIAALRIRPDDAPARFALASAQEQRGHLREALATVRAIAASMPYEQRYVIADEARLRLRLGDSSALRSGSANLRRLGARNGVDEFEAALFYLTAGLEKRASDALRRGARTHDVAPFELYDPRFTALHPPSTLQRLLPAAD